MGETSESIVPTFVRLFAFVQRYGWFIVIVMLAVGFNFQTPATKIEALSQQLRQLQDSVHVIRDAQRAEGELVIWNANVTCHKLTQEEKQYATPCQPTAR